MELCLRVVRTFVGGMQALCGILGVRVASGYEILVVIRSLTGSWARICGWCAPLVCVRSPQRLSQWVWCAPVCACVRPAAQEALTVRRALG